MMIKEVMRGERERERDPTWFSLPHVTKNLDMACDLFLGARDTVPLEVIYEELVAPTAPAAGLGVCCVGGTPVIL